MSWIPIDLAAEAIVEIISSSSSYSPGIPKVIHLIPPRPVSWHFLALQLADCLSLVPYTEWLEKLENAGDEKLRATRLLPFFRNAMHMIKGEAFGLPMLDGKNAIALSPRVLGNQELISELGKPDAERWMLYWKQVG